VKLFNKVHLSQANEGKDGDVISPANDGQKPEWEWKREDVTERHLQMTIVI
jgi:hypothetical protein